ncbi:MAG: DNA/RNA non-specific endonuclease [Bacteroidota bacterium]
MIVIRLIIFIILVIQSYFLWSNDSFIPISSGEITRHNYYLIAYNEDTEQANWVYYKLTKEMTYGDAERTNFRMDPLVSTKSATVSDYTNSGYDRGHLCPAADMKFSKDAMYESFYMSNVSPQVPGFNRGIWKKLESQVRNWVQDKDSLYVVTGPIFNDTDLRIGDNKVKVPAYFYKVLYEPAHNKMIAFILPNQASTQPLENFASTVDSLEMITNINFFSQLHDKLENQIESKIELDGWINESSNSISTPIKRSNNSLLIFLLAIIGIIFILYILQRRN